MQAGRHADGMGLRFKILEHRRRASVPLLLPEAASRLYAAVVECPEVEACVKAAPGWPGRLQHQANM